MWLTADCDLQTKTQIFAVDNHRVQVSNEIVSQSSTLLFGKNKFRKVNHHFKTKVKKYLN